MCENGSYGSAEKLQKFLLKQLGWNDYGHFRYLAEACKVAIIYNQPKILDKLLKYLPRNFKEENKFKYLHFQWESLNEPLHLRCGSYLHEQIDLSHTNLRAI